MTWFTEVGEPWGSLLEDIVPLWGLVSPGPLVKAGAHIPFHGLRFWELGAHMLPWSAVPDLSQVPWLLPAGYMGLRSGALGGSFSSTLSCDSLCGPHPILTPEAMRWTVGPATLTPWQGLSRIPDLYSLFLPRLLFGCLWAVGKSRCLYRITGLFFCGPRVFLPLFVLAVQSYLEAGYWSLGPGGP